MYDMVERAALIELAKAEHPQKHKPDFFESYTGRKIKPADPQANDIDIEDIAHALSHVCRFAGHCRKFYSVATHSMHVYLLVRSQTSEVNTIRWSLLHDASEAYIHDITRPLKVTDGMSAYRELEALWDKRIQQAFGIDDRCVDHQLVKEADNHALKKEAIKLMRSGGADWGLPETREFPEVLVGDMHVEHTLEQTRDMFIRTWWNVK